MDVVYTRGMLSQRNSLLDPLIHSLDAIGQVQIVLELLFTLEMYLSMFKRIFFFQYSDYVKGTFPLLINAKRHTSLVGFLDGVAGTYHILPYLLILL